MSFAALNMLFVMVGIVPLSEFLPVFVKNNAGVSEHGIGLVFFVNTLTIVRAPAADLEAPGRAAAHGRARLDGRAWSVSWFAVLVTGAWLESGTAVAALIVIGMVFAVGECLHGTVQGPVVVDLSQPQLIGRYMAVSSLSWQVAFIIGPAIGGAILGAQPLALWPLAATLALVGAAWALRLEPRLPRWPAGLPRPCSSGPGRRESRPPLRPVWRPGLRGSIANTASTRIDHDDRCRASPGSAVSATSAPRPASSARALSRASRRSPPTA